MWYHSEISKRRSNTRTCAASRSGHDAPINLRITGSSCHRSGTRIRWRARGSTMSATDSNQAARRRKGSGLGRRVAFAVSGSHDADPILSIERVDPGANYSNAAHELPGFSRLPFSSIRSPTDSSRHLSSSRQSLRPILAASFMAS